MIIFIKIIEYKCCLNFFDICFLIVLYIFELLCCIDFLKDLFLIIYKSCENLEKE